MLKKVISAWLVWLCMSGAVAAKDLNHWQWSASYSDGNWLTTDKSYDIYGYRTGIAYFPHKYEWHGFDIFFEGSWAHFRSNKRIASDTKEDNESINLYALAPIFRKHFSSHYSMTPYLDVSVGPAWWDDSNFEGRDFGIHYTFQDFIALGALYGKNNHISTSVRIIHYSNGNLSSDNRGLTMPVMLTLAARF